MTISKRIILNIASNNKKWNSRETEKRTSRELFNKEKVEKESDFF